MFFGMGREIFLTGGVCDGFGKTKAWTLTLFPERTCSFQLLCLFLGFLHLRWHTSINTNQNKWKYNGKVPPKMNMYLLLLVPFHWFPFQDFIILICHVWPFNSLSLTFFSCTFKKALCKHPRLGLANVLAHRVVTVWDFHGMIIVSENITVSRYTVLNNQNSFFF